MNGTILFMSGDYEAPSFCRFRSKADIQQLINKHFVYSFLIADKVIIPAGCYFESDYTTNLVDKYHNLFLPFRYKQPVAGLAIGEDRDSFKDDIIVKASWFPEPYVFSDVDKTKILLERIVDIDPLKRSGKMRRYLSNNILNDIDPRGTSFHIIQKTGYSEHETVELLRPLDIIVNEQKYAMLPPYIQIETEKQNASFMNVQRRWLNFILFKNYVISCENAYGAYCNNPLSIWYDDIFKLIYSFHVDYRDTLLFDEFAKIFPLKEFDNVQNWDTKKILEIKYSSQFCYYLECYKKVIERIRQSLELYILSQNYPNAGYTLGQELKKEKAEYKKRIITDNTYEAEILYRSIHRVFTFSKKKAFKKWLSTQDIDLPMISIMSALDSDKNGIVASYIKELSLAIEEKRKKEAKNMNRNIINSIFAIGNKQITTINEKNLTTGNGDAASKVEGKTLVEHDEMTNRIIENKKEEKYRFKVALSFPGEYRAFVEETAYMLSDQLGKEKILYDKYYEAEFARPDLDLYLQNLYSNQSELIVVFICAQYDAKAWCGVEWRAIRKLLNNKEARKRIMYIKIGPGEVEGVSLIIDGCFDATNKSPKDVADAIITRYSIT